jgi:hypothetical protein
LFFVFYVPFIFLKIKEKAKKTFRKNQKEKLKKKNVLKKWNEIINIKK